jgi:hypothetical protein
MLVLVVDWRVTQPTLVLMDMEVAGKCRFPAAELITSDVDAWGPSLGNDLKISLIMVSNWLADLNRLFVAESAIMI